MPDAAVSRPLGGFLAFRMVFHKRRQKLPLLDPHESFVQLGMFLKVLLCFLRLVMILGIIEHGRTHTDLPLLAHKDLIVDTAFTACPEGIVLGQLGIGHRLITQLGIYLHHGQARSQTKDLGVGIGLAAQLEDLFLDLFGKSAFPEARGDDKPRIGDIFAMTPGLDITKTGPHAVIRKGYDGLAFADLFFYIFRTTFGNAGTPGFCGGLHFVYDDLGEILVGLVRYYYLKVLLLFHDSKKRS